MPRKHELLDTSKRDAEGDLLAAFIMAGWESERRFPLEQAVIQAKFLAEQDADKARKISGYLMRGERLPADLLAWVRDMGVKRRAEIPG